MWEQALEGILLIVCSFAFGYAGGAVRALAIHRLQLGLQLRIKDLEERLLREDKRFAGSQRWAKRTQEEELLKATLEATKARPEPEEKAPWAMFA